MYFAAAKAFTKTPSKTVNGGSNMGLLTLPIHQADYLQGIAVLQRNGELAFQLSAIGN
ncbi:hypothetical protein ACFIOZ_18275 [Vreelandella sp. F11]|uniref:hypothetical protein n=1 Tax=Vreelandella sp. F11 TaxID=3394751 RepID=UPI0036D7AB24